MAKHEEAKFNELGRVIQARQTELGTTDEQIAEALGYDHTRVIGLIKRGAMKLPIAKVTELAGVLDIDAAELLREVLGVNDPGLLKVLEHVLGPMALTQEEVGVLHTLRAMKSEIDVLQDDPVFAGRSVMELAVEGKVRIRGEQQELEPDLDATPRKQLRIVLAGPLPQDPIAVDRLGDPLKVSSKEALVVYAYRATCNGERQTTTLELPNAVVVVVPRGH